VICSRVQSQTAVADSVGSSAIAPFLRDALFSQEGEPPAGKGFLRIAWPGLGGYKQFIARVFPLGWPQHFDESDNTDYQAPNPTPTCGMSECTKKRGQPAIIGFSNLAQSRAVIGT